MSTPKVSVLVPVYNVERFLPQCLDALCGQTLRDIEIICINDGATDGSPTILHDYAVRDQRVRVIDKANSGYGASLNMGLSQAAGEYIGIIEPDDFPDKRMFKKLLKVAERTHADVVKCNYFNYFEGSDHLVENFAGLPYRRAFDPVDYPQVVCSIPSIWTGLYRKTFLECEGISLRETPGAAFQDAGFSLKVWFAARTCALVKKPLLHYRMDNPGSSSKTTDKVFTVCEERARVLLPWLAVDKWGKYRWNFERISASEHVAFAQRMVDEYRASQDANELDYSLFKPEDAALLRNLLDVGAEAFAAAHPDSY